MSFFMKNKRIMLSLLCIMCSFCFLACAGETQGEKATSVSKQTDTSTVSQQNKYDISIPQEITMEIFGINLLEVDRPTWQRKLRYLMEDSIPGENERVFFSIGEYEVFHSYEHVENKNNMTAQVTYKTDVDNGVGLQIQFDGNDRVTKIDVSSPMGNEFHTSFLNIGDNVKDYFESFEKGLWERFLKDEEILSDQGWGIRHSILTSPNNTYDCLQVLSSNMFISYIIKDEVVEHIMLGVLSDIVLSESEQTQESNDDMDICDFYLNGNDISNMSGSDWLNLFDFPQDDENAEKFKEQWMSFFDFSPKAVAPEGSINECYVKLNGQEVYLHYYGDNSQKWITITIYPDGNGGDRQPDIIELCTDSEGYYNISVYVYGEDSLISSNNIKPGDNIRTILDSYEEGLFDKMMSLSDGEGYSVGPYYFEYYRDGNVINMGKRDEGFGLPHCISFENETVTIVKRLYGGTATGFTDKPSVW